MEIYSWEQFDYALETIVKKSEEGDVTPISNLLVGCEELRYAARKWLAPPSERQRYVVAPIILAGAEWAKVTVIYVLYTPELTSLIAQGENDWPRMSVESFDPQQCRNCEWSSLSRNYALDYCHMLNWAKINRAKEEEI